jgi:hypothetical protein
MQTEITRYHRTVTQLIPRYRGQYLAYVHPDGQRVYRHRQVETTVRLDCGHEQVWQGALGAGWLGRSDVFCHVCSR